MMISTDYTTVTELAGDEVSSEQVDRLCRRYYWAGPYCEGKDVVEVACGTGQGLGYLKGISGSLEAGDYSESILSIARRHYGDRISLSQFDAQKLPFPDSSKDVIILFEALYYLPSAESFLRECRRVLRRNGKLLISTANKDLFDFNPSPFTFKYFGVRELEELFASHGFDIKCYGDTRVDATSIRQRCLRPVKKLAVQFNLIPKSMKYKKFLKRLVFGGLVPMPAEIPSAGVQASSPFPLDLGKPDRSYKVIFAEGTLLGADC